MIRSNVPGFGHIDIVAYYNEFAGYYPNFEPATKRWFVENIQNDWVIIDCGANIGIFSILFAKLAEHGHVYSFEPTSTIAMLRENIAYHGLTNVTTIEAALGNTNGQQVENIFRIWGNAPEQQQYHFITIDDFVQTAGLAKVDCIKIDVDSFDFEVLQGARETLLQYDPYIMVELNHALSRRNQANTQALEWLAALGYTKAVVLDVDNFLLKRAFTPTSLCRTLLLHFPLHANSDNGATYQTGAIGCTTVSVSDYGIEVPGVHVFDLHRVMGFDEELDYPRDSLVKRFANWKMEVDDAPIFRYLYRNLRPRRHLEFGTWLGKGTMYCLEESAATVWTVNRPFGDKGDYGFGAEELSAAHAWARKVGITYCEHGYTSDSLGFIGKCYLENNMGSRVCQIYCDSREWDTTQYPTDFFDTVLIDGGHQREIVVNDTRKAIPLLRSGGTIMWHDFCPTEYPRFEACKGVMSGIAELWESLRHDMAQLFWIYPSMILVGIKK